MMTADTIRSKGYTVKGALAFVEKTYGKDSINRLIQSFEPPFSEILQSMIVPSKWYPFELQVRLYETIDSIFGNGDLQLCWAIGRFTAEYELSSIHRIVLKMGRPEQLMKLSGFMWGRYYSAGKLEFEKGEGNTGVAMVKDFNPISKAFCTDLAGWMERTLELTGTRHCLVQHTACVLDGASECRYEGSWEA